MSKLANINIVANINRFTKKLLSRALRGNGNDGFPNTPEAIVLSVMV